MTRPSKDEYFLEMAQLVARRGTCARRQVGCVLVDNRSIVLATAYNGVPKDVTHCIDKSCPGRSFSSGQGLSECQAIHAEMNALLWCSDVSKIETLYSTASPCNDCLKVLLNTSTKNIVFIGEYPSSWAKELWLSTGRSWLQISSPKECI